MVQDYLMITVFASFPEALLMILIGLNLSNIRKINASKLLIVACIQSVVALSVRVLNIYFGVHTIIQIASLYVLVIIFFKIKYYKAIVPVLIGMLSQGLIQSIILPIINDVCGIEISNLYNSPKNLILCSIPIVAISLILLIIIKRNRLSLCDISG